MEQRLRTLARRHGGVAWKWVSPGTTGVPDRILILPGGRIYLVELKCPGGRLSPVQESVRRRLADLGVTVHVVDDPDRFFRDVIDREDEDGQESQSE